MAYMDQLLKKKIAAELDKVIPIGTLSYTLKVVNYSTIIMTIRKGNMDLLSNYNQTVEEHSFGDSRIRVPEAARNIDQDINHYYLDRQFSGECLKLMTSIKQALNKFNHDRSDIQTDYFDVGYFIHIKLGLPGKPYECVESVQ